MKPENVQIRRADGTILDCELIHLGVDADGTDRWEIANAVYQHGDQITIGVMPPGTGISFAAGDHAADRPNGFTVDE